MQKLKKCYKCKKLLQTKKFNKNKTKKDKLQPSCKICQRKVAGTYYRKNKKRCIKIIGINKRKRALGNYIEIITKHLNVPCADCKKVYHPSSMVFDHKIGSLKKEGVNFLVKSGYSKKAIQEEIDKCEVRCQNCHHLKTSKDFNHWKEIAFLINDYSSIIKKLYKKHWNFFDFSTFKIQKNEISKKFSSAMLEKAHLEMKKKKERMDEY